MPELPEVETVVRDLRPQLVGAQFSAIYRSRSPLRKPWRKAWKTQLQGRTVQAVQRRGKWIILQLHDHQRLLIHLGMTGQLVVRTKDEPRQDHTHLTLTLDEGARELRFRDVRRFGSATLFANEAEVTTFFEGSQLGPEPFALDRDYWRERLTSTSRCLKAVLLDQTVVAGVGNIYADEALFQSKLHPQRLGRSLSHAEADRLRRAVATVLTRAIEKRGSTIRDYIGGSGLQGGYQNEFRAYGRTGDPCSQCRASIVQVRLAGRSTHYCPACQTLEEDARVDS